jgi:hypothetical protein
MTPTTRVFRRRLAYQIADIGCVPPLFAISILFLGLAIAEPGSLPLDFIVLFVGGLAVMLGGLLTGTLRHGVRRIAIKVGPDGLWVPESGWLPWGEIEEVRLEILVNRAAASDPSQLSRRIGIVPRDRSLRARIPMAQRLASPLYNLYFKQFNPYAEEPPVKLAPFGVYEYEVAVGLEPVLAAIAEYRLVTEHRGALAGMS